MPLLLPSPGPAPDAFRIAAEREVLPLALGTQEIREQLAWGVRSKAVFAARATSAVFLEAVQEVVLSILGDQRGEGDERLAGMTVAEGRAILKEVLDALGYTPEGGFPGDLGTVPPAVEGTLQDLRSRRRLDLIIKTQMELMQGAGQKMRGQDNLVLFPAWELVRYEGREVPRDWFERFEEAGGTILIDAAGRRRLVAHKNDPVWEALGDSALFDDALDVDHPPFAFNSGMGWLEVSLVAFQAMGGALLEVESKTISDEEESPRLLPDNVASVGHLGTLEKLVADFDEATATGKRVSAKDLLERDKKNARASYAKRYNLNAGGAR